MKRDIARPSTLENIRHSLAHLLAMAVLKKFPSSKLGIGPTIENGFYYDFGLPRALTAAELPELEQTMRELIAKNPKFKGRKTAPAEARKIFKEQPFKLDLIREFTKGKKPLTLYRSGDFVDLCRGGHVGNASEINPQAFRLTNLAAAYWRGDERKPQLTRIYGVAFETVEELKRYQQLQEEIEKRDHRVLGEKLELFSQHGVAPGAIFWHPKGMILWRGLEEFMRKKLDAAGYGEISTPVMVKKDVFERSGHWEHYRKNIFTLKINTETYALKPMNCPESTYIYSSRLRSWRDLPLRFSEITDRLHRNEPSGTLGGLFRVRQMTQDDAHIYCRPDQIESEIEELIGLIKRVYTIFDLPLSFNLATKPRKAMGDPKLWKRAERALEKVLKNSRIPYILKPGDGAFYGPKIDVNARDSLGREWTVATIQLDFLMPQRFELAYIDVQGKKQYPVMIHRAILGSFERFIGILIEHYAGAFPFWLSPIQVAVLSVADAARSYSASVATELEGHGIRVSRDDRNETIGKKIREAELQKIPYLLIIGQREAESKTIAVRKRGAGDQGGMRLESFLAMAKQENQYD